MHLGDQIVVALELGLRVAVVLAVVAGRRRACPRRTDAVEDVVELTRVDVWQVPLAEVELRRSGLVDSQAHQVHDCPNLTLSFGVVAQREQVVVLSRCVHHGVPHVRLETAPCQLLVHVEHAGLAEVDLVGALGHQRQNFLETCEQDITGNVLLLRLVVQQSAGLDVADEQFDRSGDSTVSAAQPHLDRLVVLEAFEKCVRLHARLVDSEPLRDEGILHQVSELDGERDGPRAGRVSTSHAVCHCFAVNATPVREFTGEETVSSRTD